MRSDEELMKLVSEGDREAFAEIVNRYERLALSLANNLMDNPNRAEEIAQEAFLKIYRNAENYQATATFRSYLGRVVTRLCYDSTEKNEPLTLNPADLTHRKRSGPDPLQEILESEQQQVIRDLLEELPKRQRTALVLQTMEEFSYDEIAEFMDTTNKAVERLLARAREALRSKLSEFVETE